MCLIEKVFIIAIKIIFIVLAVNATQTIYFAVVMTDA